MPNAIETLSNLHFPHCGEEAFPIKTILLRLGWLFGTYWRKKIYYLSTKKKLKVTSLKIDRKWWKKRLDVYFLYYLPEIRGNGNGDFWYGSASSLSGKCEVRSALWIGPRTPNLKQCSVFLKFNAIQALTPHYLFWKSPSFKDMQEHCSRDLCIVSPAFQTIF